MTIMVPDTGEIILLEAAVGKTATQNWYIHLFSDNNTPTESTVVGDFTEVTGGGYASKSLVSSGWDNASTDGGVTSIEFGTLQTWTFTAAVGAVYGYYITRSAGLDLVYAERFTSAPYTISNVGDKIEITPKIELD